MSHKERLELFAKLRRAISDRDYKERDRIRKILDKDFNDSLTGVRNK